MNGSEDNLATPVRKPDVTGCQSDTWEGDRNAE